MTTSFRAFRRALILTLATALVALAFTGPAAAQRDASTTDDVSVDILALRGLFDPASASAVADVIATATERGSSLVVLQIDSPGAVSVDPAQVIEDIRRAEVPVVVFIGPGLGSAQAANAAGALYLAAPLRAMAFDATLGPIDPLVLGRDRDDADVLTALVHDSLATTDDLRVPLSTDDAVRLDLVDLSDIGGITDLLTELNGTVVQLASGERTLVLEQDQVSVRFHSLGFVRRTLHAIVVPELVYLALAFALGLLLFELFQPGFGVAGMAGLILLPLAVYGLFILPVTWWAAIVLFGGFGLLAADVAIAGFGPPTFLGTAMVGVGSWKLFPDVGNAAVGLPAWMTITVTIAAFFFFVVVMTIILRAQAGPDPDALGALVGRNGVVRSALNPEGHVYIDEALWRARWTGEEDGKIAVGTAVEVWSVEGAVLLVDAIGAQAIIEAAADPA